MLARLSRTCSQLADFGWSASSLRCSELKVEDDEVGGNDLLPPEATAFSQLSLTVPENTLESVAGTCGKLFSPLYRFAGSVLSTDVEKVIVTLHEADPNFSADLEDEDEDDSEDIYVIPFPSSGEPASDPRLLLRESSDACNSESSLSNSTSSCARGGGHVSESSVRVPQNLRPIPRIVITPAPPQCCREMSSCVPVQDTSFGSRLTVPAHIALNACHPPMKPPSSPHMPLYTTVRSWTYKQGHWCAVIPGLDEQERRGIFSRPINSRRRAMRKRIIAARDHAVSCQKNMFARGKRDS